MGKKTSRPLRGNEAGKEGRGAGRDAREHQSCRSSCTLMFSCWHVSSRAIQSGAKRCWLPNGRAYMPRCDQLAIL